MTTGQMLFYGGVALLIFTVLLAIFFIIKKPQYKPENAVYNIADGKTAQLRNGYPTAPVTIRRSKPTVLLPKETMPLEKKTEPLDKM